MGNPFPLNQNLNKSFQGSIVLGKGFILTSEEAEKLINKDPRNKDVLFPYLNGDDLNNDPDQKPSRWVINFFDWSAEKAKSYPDCFELVERLVKPERQRWKNDSNGNDLVGTYALRKPLPQKWWIYGEKRPALYNTISKLDQVMVISEVTKYVSFTFAPVNIVFMHTIKVIAWSDWASLALLNSSIYCEWAWKYSSTMGSGTLRYTPSTSFETFPFKTNVNEFQLLNSAGENFYNCRKKLMRESQLGLTKIYNLLHDRELKLIQKEDAELTDKNFETKYGKQASQLKKHLQNVIGVGYDEVLTQIQELRSLLVEIDNLFVTFYGWTDIQLRHDFYELDYLPEHDRIRFTIHPEVRKEILKRLIRLNNQMYVTDVNYYSKERAKGREKSKILNSDNPTLF